MDWVNSISELLENPHFRNRIQMYLGKKEISLLNQFLFGVHMAQSIYDIKSIEGDFSYGEFHDQVCDFYKWPESTSGWKNMILTESNGDEEKAVDEFFRVYDLIKGRT